jgi:YHS domain-containing protein
VEGLQRHCVPSNDIIKWSQEEKEVSKVAKDPVCKMEVDEKKAAARSKYKGKAYYFCAPGCKKSFDANPEKYIGGGGQKAAGHGGNKM